jgi:hypothetical protein
VADFQRVPAVSPAREKMVAHPICPDSIVARSFPGSGAHVSTRAIYLFVVLIFGPDPARFMKRSGELSIMIDENNFW